jgi:hypothetical protein
MRCRFPWRSYWRRQGAETESDRIPFMTVFVYVDTSKQVGYPDHIKVFATADAAATWFEENDPEGAAFEYEILE